MGNNSNNNINNSDNNNDDNSNNNDNSNNGSNNNSSGNGGGGANIINIYFYFLRKFINVWVNKLYVFFYFKKLKYFLIHLGSFCLLFCNLKKKSRGNWLVQFLIILFYNKIHN